MAHTGLAVTEAEKSTDSKESDFAYVTRDSLQARLKVRETRPFVFSRNGILASWPAWTGIGRDWTASVHGADGRYLGPLGPGTDLRALRARLLFLRLRDAANGRPSPSGRNARLPDRLLLH